MKHETEQFKNDFLPLQPVMQRVAERLLGNEEDAADVVQDCFVALWSQRESQPKVVNREAWCVTMVKRRCIDLLRRRRPTVAIDEGAMELADDPADDYEERLRVVEDLLDRLPERQAQVVRLKHFDAADTQQIADRLHIAPGNVYTLLSRAYSSLKQMINGYERQ